MQTARHKKRDSIILNPLKKERPSIDSSQHNTFLLESKDNTNPHSMLV